MTALSREAAQSLQTQALWAVSCDSKKITLNEPPNGLMGPSAGARGPERLLSCEKRLGAQQPVARPHAYSCRSISSSLATCLRIMRTPDMTASVAFSWPVASDCSILHRLSSRVSVALVAGGEKICGEGCSACICASLREGFAVGTPSYSRAGTLLVSTAPVLKLTRTSLEWHAVLRIAVFDCRRRAFAMRADIYGAALDGRMASFDEGNPKGKR